MRCQHCDKDLSIPSGDDRGVASGDDRGVASAEGRLASEPSRAPAAPASRPVYCHHCGAPIDPAVQSELGHLRYVVADVRFMSATGMISAAGAQFLSDRYERRQQELLNLGRQPVLADVAKQGAIPPPPPSPRPISDRPGSAIEATATVGRAPSATKPSRPPIDAPVVLLWLGAFLVTVASLIFVGYNWAAFSGPVKTLIMIGLTSVFFVSGGWCYTRPTLRPAGRTFVAIGAALTPLTGLAAYTFWLGGLGIKWELLGILVSLGCAALYGLLAIRLKEELYPPAAVVAVTAAVGFGLAQVGLFERWWAPVAAILGCIFALTARQWLNGRLTIFRRAVDWSGWGLTGLAALSQASLGLQLIIDLRWMIADWWVTTVVLIALTARAGLAAWRPRLVLPVLATLGLATLTIMSASQALGGGRAGAVLACVGSALIATVAGGRLTGQWRRAVVPFAAALAIVTPWWVLDDRTPFVVAAALATVALVIAVIRRQEPAWLFGAAALVPFGYFAALGWLGSSSTPVTTTLASWPLLLLAMGGVTVAGHRGGTRWALPAYAGLLLTGLLVIIALLTDQPFNHQMGDLRLQLVIFQLLGLALLTWLAVGLVGEALLIAVPIVLLYGSLAALLAFRGDGAEWFALAGMPLTWAIWLMAPRRGQPAWWVARLGSYQRALGGGALLICLLLALVTTDSQPGSLWWRWLIGLLLVQTVLMGSVAYWQRRRWLAEAAAASAIGALLAQFGSSGQSELQLYSLPVATWLLAVGVLRDRTGQVTARPLVWAGVAVLILPALGQSLGEAGWRYSLLAGAEGLALLGIGLRLRLRALIAGGTLTVSLIAARQVFDSARSLPNWVIIGLVGLTLLSLALVLLLQRERLGQVRSGLQERWQTWH